MLQKKKTQINSQISSRKNGQSETSSKKSSHKNPFLQTAAVNLFSKKSNTFFRTLVYPKNVVSLHRKSKDNTAQKPTSSTIFKQPLNPCLSPKLTYKQDKHNEHIARFNNLQCTISYN